MKKHKQRNNRGGNRTATPTKSRMDKVIEQILARPKFVFETLESIRDLAWLFGQVYYKTQHESGYYHTDEYAKCIKAFKSVARYMDFSFTPKAVCNIIEALAEFSERGTYRLPREAEDFWGNITQLWIADDCERAVQCYRSLFGVLSLDPRTHDNGFYMGDAVVFLLTRDFNLGRTTEEILPLVKPMALLHEAAYESDEACDILEHAYGMLMHVRVYSAPFTQVDSFPDLVNDPRARTRFWEASPKAIAGYNRHINRKAELLITDDFEEMEALVLEKFDEIGIMLELLWDDILRNAKRDVSPDGRDSFRVTGVLGSLYGESRFFVRQRAKFPDVNVTVIKDWALPGKLYHTGIISPNLTEIDPGFTCSLTRLADLLVTTMAYQKIVTREPKKHSNGGTEERPTSDIPREQVERAIGDYLMALRPGWKPDPKKRAAFMEKFHHDLPEGKTYVKSFSRPYYVGPMGERATKTDDESPQTQEDAAFTLDPVVILKEL